MTSTIRISMVASCVVGLMCAIGVGAPSALAADDRCLYEGKPYSDGAASCQGSVRYECDDGEWKSTDEPCSAGVAIERRDTVKVPSTEERTVIEKKTEVERTE